MSTKYGKFEWAIKDEKFSSYSKKKKEYSENKSKQAEEIV